jgi:uncharacterized protein with ParB-like and HNH nuclease domain
VSGWWADVVGGKRDHLGVHNSGNVVLIKSDVERGDWVCIDGQQRMTTTALLVAALRYVRSFLFVRISHTFYI